MSQKKLSATQHSTLQIAIIVAIVFVASLFVLFRPVPEQIAVRSEDGNISFEGVARPAGSVVIERRDEINQADGVMSPVYELTATTSSVIEQGELVFFVSNEDLDLTELTLYKFDVSTLSWQALPSIFDLNAHAVSAPFNFSGSVLVAIGSIE